MVTSLSALSEWALEREAFDLWYSLRTHGYRNS